MHTEERTMREAPPANSCLVLGEGDKDLGSSLDHISLSNNRMERPSQKEQGQDKKRISFHSSDDIAEGDTELFKNPIDTPVPGALDGSDMSGKPVLRDELERIEARIAEVRKEELGVDDRLAEIQREKDDLVETRAALEEAANLMRQRLGRPASSIVVQLAPSQQVRPRPTQMVPQRRIRPGTRRDQFLAVLRPFLLKNGGSAGRQEIRQVWHEAGLFEDVQNPDSALSGMLNHLKNAGHITNDNSGTYTWIGLRDENGRA